MNNVVCNVAKQLSFTSYSILLNTHAYIINLMKIAGAIERLQIITQQINNKAKVNTYILERPQSIHHITLQSTCVRMQTRQYDITPLHILLVNQISWFINHGDDAWSSVNSQLDRARASVHVDALPGLLLWFAFLFFFPQEEEGQEAEHVEHPWDEDAHGLHGEGDVSRRRDEEEAEEPGVHVVVGGGGGERDEGHGPADPWTPRREQQRQRCRARLWRRAPELPAVDGARLNGFLSRQLDGRHPRRRDGRLHEPPPLLIRSRPNPSS